MRIRNPINKRTLEQSDAHVQDYEDAEDKEEEADQGEQAQGKQPNYDARFARLEGKMQELMNVTIDARFHAFGERLNGFDGHFNSIDEGIVAILARLGNQ
ncbi:hypothetical protein AAC387_Pa03g1265 [Persea americana]